eukprot:symbB.v1.2.000674.t1/scaffold35.1/size400642/18
MPRTTFWVERHCILRPNMATTPSWSGSWLPVPPSTLWTLRAERHCIGRQRKATTPPWSGSWLPVPASMPWTTEA